ncbi:Bcl2-/adenovirus E1B 19kDa-interacting protein 2 [Trinorchestia longiramus]|nr:Bcl2-/adenovirus E1B 19kDa-interacting protein 2 [Trinorchestia longiramus]
MRAGKTVACGCGCLAGSSRVADGRKSPQSSALQAQRKTPDGVSSLEQNRRKKVSAKDAVTPKNDDDQHSLSSLDDDGDDVAQMLSHEDSHEMLTPDDINTPDELEESIMERLGPGTPDHCSREGGGPVQHEGKDESSFRAVVIQGIERRIDMQVIEPYKKVLSHGGHLVSGEAIIVFSACFLPDRARHDYDYVMDHLFMYVLTALDQLIAEDYVLVYLHGATTRANMPSFNWLKRCYQMIDRRLRKNLQVLYLVHPTFWVKTVVVMIRPFVSYNEYFRVLTCTGYLRGSMIAAESAAERLRADESCCGRYMSCSAHWVKFTQVKTKNPHRWRTSARRLKRVILV